MTNSNKSVFIDRNTSHIKHGWQEKRVIMEYNACVSCELIGHNFPTVLQILIKHGSGFHITRSAFIEHGSARLDQSKLFKLHKAQAIMSHNLFLLMLYETSA